MKGNNNMKIRMLLIVGVDDDLIALYMHLGNTAFIKVLKNVFLAYSTGLPFYIPFDLSNVNTTESENTVVRLSLSKTKYGRILSEYSSCSARKASSYLKAIARMYLTPSILSYYTDTTENNIDKHAVEASGTEIYKKKDKITKKKVVKETKKEQKEIASKKQEVPVVNKTVSESTSAESLMNNPEFMKMMAEQMAKQMTAQMPVEPEKEPEQKESTFDANLASLFGSISSE